VLDCIGSVFCGCIGCLYLFSFDLPTKNKTTTIITKITTIINNKFSKEKNLAGLIEPPFFGIISFFN
jgi:hypothetical protein